MAGDGQGQTIAIVDAYNDPDIVGDLTTFDAHFSLPSANLKVVNQTGGSKLPADNSAWSSEIALDVEWAHAIAPGANLLLVEANSDDMNDLLAGVKYARNAPDVSVVSLSWDGGEWGGETNYDNVFTTPPGHGGVTFVNSSGDTGPGSVQWPATSPNVLSVGGTTLSVSDSSGAYAGESGWPHTSGGTSSFEKMPQYQQGALASDPSPPAEAHHWQNRYTPDVAYDASPSSGFAVYDSVPYDGASGLRVVGGTSAGAPQWAALIAIADQGRNLSGKAPLDGATATLPLLYKAYAGPGTSQFAAYQSTFHDVTSGSPSLSQVAPGYDPVTGLGTPRAVQVIIALGGNAVGSGSSPNGAVVVGRLFSHMFEHPSIWHGPIPPNGAGSDELGSPDAGSDGSDPAYGTGVQVVSGPPSGAASTPSASPVAAAPSAPLGGGAPASFQVTRSVSVGSVFDPSGPAHAVGAASGASASIPLPPSTSGLRVSAASPPVAAGITAPQAHVASSTLAASRAAGIGQQTVPVFLTAFGEVARQGDLGKANAVGAVSFLGDISGISIWSQLSSLFAGGGGAPPATAEPLLATLPGSLLGLAHSPAARLDASSRAWEITAGVCLTVALAGYWYSTASPVEEQAQPPNARRLRRLRDDWQLTSLPGR